MDKKIKIPWQGTFSSVISVIRFLILSIANLPILVIVGYALFGLGIAPIIPLLFSMTGKSTTHHYCRLYFKQFSLNTAWIFLAFTSIILVFLIRILSRE